MQCPSCLLATKSFHPLFIWLSSVHQPAALTTSQLSPLQTSLTQLADSCPTLSCRQQLSSGTAARGQSWSRAFRTNMQLTHRSFALAQEQTFLTQGGCQSHLQHRKCELCVARFELAATCRRFASSAECQLDLSSIKQHAPTLSCSWLLCTCSRIGATNRRDTRLLERYQSWICANQRRICISDATRGFWKDISRGYEPMMLADTGIWHHSY